MPFELFVCRSVAARPDQPNTCIASLRCRVALSVSFPSVGSMRRTVLSGMCGIVLNVTHELGVLQRLRTVKRLAMHRRSRFRRIRRALSGMIQLLLVHVRLYAPFHRLLDMDAARFGRGGPLLLTFQDVDIRDIQPSFLWFLTAESSESFEALLVMLEPGIRQPFEHMPQHAQQLRPLDTRQELMFSCVCCG